MKKNAIDILMIINYVIFIIFSIHAMITNEVKMIKFVLPLTFLLMVVLHIIKEVEDDEHK